MSETNIAKTYLNTAVRSDVDELGKALAALHHALEIHRAPARGALGVQTQRDLAETAIPVLQQIVSGLCDRLKTQAMVHGFSLAEVAAEHAHVSKPPA